MRLTAAGKTKKNLKSVFSSIFQKQFNHLNLLRLTSNKKRCPRLRVINGGRPINWAILRYQEPCKLKISLSASITKRGNCYFLLIFFSLQFFWTQRKGKIEKQRKTPSNFSIMEVTICGSYTEKPMSAPSFPFTSDEILLISAPFLIKISTISTSPL